MHMLGANWGRGPVPIYGYARVSTDGQALDAQVAQLRATGPKKVFREKVSGARADHLELTRLLRALGPKAWF